MSRLLYQCRKCYYQWFVRKVKPSIRCPKCRCKMWHSYDKNKIGKNGQMLKYWFYRSLPIGKSHLYVSKYMDVLKYGREIKKEYNALVKARYREEKRCPGKYFVLSGHPRGWIIVRCKDRDASGRIIG